ncbi:MAG TPA: hypothetical protein GXZ30_11435, partial [Propionibacterium sp.]|nr:hypothetical protein [Propionibacterium sp.]
MSVEHTQVRIDRPLRRPPSPNRQPRDAAPAPAPAAPTGALARVPSPQRTDHPTPAHPRPRRGARTFGVLAVVFMLVAWVVSAVHTSNRIRAHGDAVTALDLTLVWIVLGTAALLSGTALVYLLNRHGAIGRLRKHQRLPRTTLDQHFGMSARAITALVPSYAEEPEVVRATLWSAALQEFPDVRVVLLIDDQPFPTDPIAQDRLRRTRDLPREIETALQEPIAVIKPFLALVRRQPGGAKPASLTAASVGDLYAYAADWLTRMAGKESTATHAEIFFVDQVLLAL